MSVAKFIYHNPTLPFRYGAFIASQLDAPLKVQQVFKHALNGLDLYNTWGNFASDISKLTQLTDLSTTIKAASSSLMRLDGLKLISLGQYLPMMSFGTQIIAVSVSVYKLKTSYDKYAALPESARSSSDLVSKATNLALDSLFLATPLIPNCKTSLNTIKLLLGTFRAINRPYPEKEKFNIQATVYASLRNI